jgi:hypothetical protein
VSEVIVAIDDPRDPDIIAPARALYESAGFVPCGPFADYPAIWSSTRS